MSGKSGAKAESGERIAKVMARAGLCSRREAEAWIAAGRVAVNGAVIASPALNITAEDRVTVDGEPLPTRERTRLFLYHKPRGLVTTHADPQGRPTIFDALPKTLPRLLSVGRLDMNTEGLLLLTNDGGLARVLELPQTGWLRRYRVRAHGKVEADQLAALHEDITIDGIRYGGIDARIDREQGSNVWLTFAMREGKNREVKNVLGHLGLAVNRLIRVSFGPFQLGALPEGTIEEVRTRHLREQLGDKVAAVAGADFTAPIVVREEEPRPVPETATRAPKRDDRPARRNDGPRSGKPHGAKPRSDRSHSDKAHSDRPRGAKEHRDGPRSAKSHTAKLQRGKPRERRHDEDRFGGPELARRERRGRPFRGKRR